MRICIIDDRGGTIPALEYGGTERVIWGLGKELYALGHEITYLVPKGSSCPFANVIFREPNRQLEEQIPEDIDLIHINYTPPKPFEKPYLITVHGNPLPEEALDKNSVFISKNQAFRYNSDVFVHNGLSWEDYPTPNLTAQRKGYHFLGKASWSVKNAAGAMRIAQALNEKIHIIGGNKWNLRNIKSGFFQLFDSKIRFDGFLNDADKTAIMQASKALIFPVKWHEPFGLAIIESLYCGCAVFGTQNGSLPELITPYTGATATSQKDLIQKIKNFDFNPERCHNYAVENFNARVMTLNYLKLYKKVLAGEQLHATAPCYIEERNKIQHFQ